MQRDIITFLKDRLQLFDVMDPCLQRPCGRYGNIRIISIDIHAQGSGCIRHLHADRAQSDDTELLSHDLRSGKLALSLFHRLCDIRPFQGLHPFDAFDDLARCQQKARDGQLFDRIRIRPRRIEDDDARLAAALQRNVVDTGTGTGDALERCRKLHLMKRCAAHQDRIIISQLIPHLIAISIQFLQAGSRYFIEQLYLHLTFLHLSLQMLS